MPNEPLLTRKSYKEQLEKQNRELEELESRQERRESRESSYGIEEDDYRLLKEKKSYFQSMRKKLPKYTARQNQDLKDTIIF